jgi:hypothetical protein
MVPSRRLPGVLLKFVDYQRIPVPHFGFSPSPGDCRFQQIALFLAKYNEIKSPKTTHLSSQKTVPAKKQPV